MLVVVEGTHYGDDARHSNFPVDTFHRTADVILVILRTLQETAALIALKGQPSPWCSLYFEQGYWSFCVMHACQFVAVANDCLQQLYLNKKKGEGVSN